MEIITIENNKYVLGDYVLENAVIYSKGIRSSRELIKKKLIDTKYYIYARNTEDNWIITNGKSVKFDKILLTYDFIKTINELNKNNLNKITDINGIEEAPYILELDDNEKFKDDEGNILEIETRGERKYDKIYFKVKDVMNEFNMKNLYDTIKDDRNTYTENKDYKYFICKNPVPNNNQTIKKIKCIKTLFLTYEGILRVLFISRNNKTSKFIKWCVETLFTIQIGTTEQKTNLISNMLGVNAKVVKEVFNADSNTLPCIYLFTLGYAKDLRESMNINNSIKDDSIIAKFGFTKNLSRRTEEHIKTYGNIDNCDFKLKYYTYIDPQYISTAETDIKELFDSLELKLEYKNYQELVIIPQSLLKIISEKYNHIGKKYAGHISELITKIKELENEKKLKELEFELALQKEQHKNELSTKEIEMLQYKILLLQKS